MIYCDFQDIKLSALGLGCMRLPRNGETDADIDQAETQRMVDYAMAQGVNYYDTAWGYHEGKSEAAIGQALRRYPRESYYLATKFPGYDLSNMPKVEEIFEQQLKRCGVEYFDFYLFHNVCEMNIDAYLDPKYGILDYLRRQKEQGRIRHLGFSAHGSYDVIKRFLDAYGSDMEFCQLQVNYVDWKFQDAADKVRLAQERGLPIWVMEPLRGGRLAALKPEEMDKLQALRPGESAVGWAFRFLQSLPGVSMVLSGMSSMEQLEQNIAIYADNRPLNDQEMAAVLSLGEQMIQGVPCTACHYCTTHCPQGLDIPALLKLYNEHTFTGGGFIAPMALQALPEDKRPSACIGCRSCEQVCPQQIKISEVLADFAAKVKA